MLSQIKKGQKIMREYKELIKRLKEQGFIDSEDEFYVYIENRSLDGEECLKGTQSQDGKWLCLPIKRYDDFTDAVYYEPRCFEIHTRFQTYLKNDDMYYLVTAYLLYKEE